MLYQETNKHWDNFSSTIALLLVSGRRDPKIIAIMATESFFRPILHRILEAVYWFALDIIAPEKTKNISVGISQVQVRHWQTAGIISPATSRISALINSFNPLINYDVCKSFLDNANIRHVEAKKMICNYTGKTTKYHISIFEHFLKCSLKVCASHKYTP